jgi:K(+)-stimulated pyrophosphate-energized sodium pump
MNMVSLLTLGLVLKYNVIEPTSENAARAVGAVLAFAGIAIVAWAVWQSKRDTPEMAELESRNRTMRP